MGLQKTTRIIHFHSRINKEWKVQFLFTREKDTLWVFIYPVISWFVRKKQKKSAYSVVFFIEWRIHSLKKQNQSDTDPFQYEKQKIIGIKDLGRVAKQNKTREYSFHCNITGQNEYQREFVFFVLVEETQTKVFFFEQL